MQATGNDGPASGIRDGAGAMTDVAATLKELRTAGLYRQLRVIESAQGPRVRLDGREVILLCSNDYLGLAGHHALRAAVADAAYKWGAGAGASRLVSGNMSPHSELEVEIAAFKGYDRCVLFGSGFLANVGVIAALAGRGEVVLSDELNHASIVDGCRQARAETIVYAHLDMDALEQGPSTCVLKASSVGSEASRDVQGIPRSRAASGCFRTPGLVPDGCKSGGERRAERAAC